MEIRGDGLLHQAEALTQTLAVDAAMAQSQCLLELTLRQCPHVFCLFVWLLTIENIVASVFSYYHTAQ